MSPLLDFIMDSLYWGSITGILQDDENTVKDTDRLIRTSREKEKRIEAVRKNLYTRGYRAPDSAYVC